MTTKTLLPVTGLINVLENYVDKHYVKDIAHALITHYLRQDLPFEKRLFSDFISEEWIVLKLLMDIKEPIQQLRFHLKPFRNKPLISFDVTNIGVTLYVNNTNHEHRVPSEHRSEKLSVSL